MRRLKPYISHWKDKDGFIIQEQRIDQSGFKAGQESLYLRIEELKGTIRFLEQHRNVVEKNNRELSLKLSIASDTIPKLKGELAKAREALENIRGRENMSVVQHLATQALNTIMFDIANKISDIGPLCNEKGSLRNNISTNGEQPTNCNEIINCPWCGTPCRIAGKITHYYEPIKEGT